jgi:hypothetical protein
VVGYRVLKRTFWPKVGRGLEVHVARMGEGKCMQSFLRKIRKTTTHETG